MEIILELDGLVRTERRDQRLIREAFCFLVDRPP